MDRHGETPETLLDALRDHPDWDDARREEVFERLIVGFPRERLVKAIRPRLGSLQGADADAILRLAAADGSPELLELLADALLDQPDLAPEWAWEALGLIEGAGLLDEFPEVAEWRDDLADAMDVDPIDELATLMGDDPDGSWAVAQGLDGFESDVREQIVADLMRRSLPPDVVDTLRRVPEGPTGTGLALLETSRPRLTRSLVTAVNGRGRGQVVLVAEDRGEWTAAAFMIDVLEGIREAIGVVAPDPASAGRFLAGFAARPDTDAIEDVPELALRLLSGGLLLRGPDPPATLPDWLARTVGPDFRAEPILDAPDEMADPIQLDSGQVAELARAVLDAVPDWRDDSEVARELADEVRLRGADPTPDPIRDSGLFRFLFEHRLRDRLELDRRMLLWMAAFWRASGAGELARAARVLAGQLADPQHVVPGHPFVVELARRSLTSRGPSGPGAEVLGDGGPSPGLLGLDA